MEIKTILNSGDVVRFHNHSGIDKQRISEHQWGVALILEHIYPESTKGVILAALTHDAHEYYIGDIPAPVKWETPELGNILTRIEQRWELSKGLKHNLGLSDRDKIYLKIADSIEGMTYCVRQVRLGHINAKRPYRKWREFIYDYIFKARNDNDLKLSTKNMDRIYKFLNDINREMETL